MKEIVQEYYGIEVIGIIKLSAKAYRIKAKQGDYVLKFVDNYNVSAIYQYLLSMNVDMFSEIVVNKYQDYISKSQDKMFYLTRYYQPDTVVIKEFKLKHYFDMLANLHRKTFYHTKVNKSFFDDLQTKIGEQIDQRIQYYEMLIEKYENKGYKSPSEWLFMFNIDKIIMSLIKSKRHLDSFYEMCKDKQSIRFVMVYQNFNHNHINMKENKFVSIDKMRISSPVYDIYEVYQHLNDIFYDLGDLVETYLKKFPLYDYEKELLACMLYLVPIINLDNNEVDNIIIITRLVHYVKSIEDMVYIIKRQQAS